MSALSLVLCVGVVAAVVLLVLDAREPKVDPYTEPAATVLREGRMVATPGHGVADAVWRVWDAGDRDPRIRAALGRLTTAELLAIVAEAVSVREESA
jgi:hypothetical protein